MPDKPLDRAEQEKAYARLMAKLLKTYGGHLLEKLGDPPDLANLGAEFWDAEARTLVKALSPFGERVYLDAARQLMEQTPVQVEWGLINQRAIDWASSYTFELVKGINDTTRDALQVAVSKFFEEEMTRGQLEDYVSPLFGPVRAEMIAVTEVTRAAARGEDAIVAELAANDIHMITTWGTDNDELVCDICMPLDGREANGRDGNNEPYWIHPDTGEEVRLPAHPRCILPGNKVVSPGFISAATKSFYSGIVIELSTASGRCLTVTPNHPILTQNGWLAAQNIQKGDDVFCASDPEGMLNSVYPDNDNRPTAIEEIFSSLKESGAMLSSTVPTSPINFYGDGRFIDGNIEIVYKDSLLRCDTYSPVGKHFSEIHFGGRDISQLDLESGGMSDFIIQSLPDSASCRMSITYLPNSLLWSHLLPFEPLRFGLSAGGDVILDEKFTKDLSTNTRLACEFILRFASFITLNPVIGVREYEFCGHVYDLQSNDYGLYICNGIIAHNCRCNENNELPEVG